MKHWYFLGKCPLCNLREDTTFHIGNFCFPLCYRCCFIILGFLFGFFLMCQKIIIIQHSLFLVFLLILPCYIDGTLQYKFHKQSTNMRRILTGFLAGIGLALFYSILISLC